MAFGIDITQITSGNLEGVSKVGLLCMQFVAAFSMFLLAPYLFLKTTDKFNLQKEVLNFTGSPKTPLLLLTVVVVLFYFPLSGYLVGINEAMELPESWSAFEQALRSMENSSKALIEHIIQFDSFLYFILAFIVIAILPGIGEEFLFRGVLQNYFRVIFKNPHIAIWVSAILFSALHMQFYGFLPRMVLGALFGYLYFWSGKLIFPMLAHALNNGFTLILVYLNQEEISPVSLEDTESVPIVMALASLIITLGLMSIFRKWSGENKKNLQI
jgi:membrane protease YdiL (CAAX protease family)